MSRNGFTGFSDRFLDRLPHVLAVTLGNNLHNMIDGKFRCHFSGAMSPNAIGQYSEQDRRFFFLIQEERSDRVTVFVVFASHPCMGLGFDVQMGAHSTYHEAYFLETIFGSASAGGWLRSKRYIKCPKWIRSP